MVNENYAYAYCKEDISLIENYDKAIADKENTWHCHHKLEIHDDYKNTAEDLKLMKLYYHRPASELIFLPQSEHARIHNKVMDKQFAVKKMHEAVKGKSKSAEHKSKIAKALKGNTNTLGLKHTTETKLKMSESHKGKIFTAEHRENMRKAWAKRKQVLGVNDGK